MARVVTMTGSPEPARVADAACARCGTRGTVGLVARGDGVPAVRARYCFHCWPTERAAASAAWQREADAAGHAFAAWVRARGRASGGPEPDGSVGLAMQTDWRGTIAELLARLGVVRARPVLERPA